MTEPRFKNANAFKTSLEERLRTFAAKEGVDLQRIRTQVAFDRLLARVFTHQPGSWYLKGGYAMELRIQGDPDYPGCGLGTPARRRRKVQA